MIVGTVKHGLEPTLTLTVFDAAGNSHSFEATIDTGFNGELTFPAALVASLGLTWQLNSGGFLADGNFVNFDMYAAKILWDGVTRVVDVEEIGNAILVGTTMLRGYRLCSDFVVGGSVWIEPIP